MRKALFTALAFVLLLPVGTVAHAAPVEQYATWVIDFSTQWTSSGQWTAEEALGEPNQFNYGDYSGAWAPSSKDAGIEYIALGYDIPVYASGAVIYESSGFGFVTRIEAFDVDTSIWREVWAGTDPQTQPRIGYPEDLAVPFSWAMTDYMVNGLRITIDTTTNMNFWEEIDAVRLQGDASPTPIPGAVWLLGSGLVGLVGIRRKMKS